MAVCSRFSERHTLCKVGGSAHLLLRNGGLKRSPRLRYSRFHIFFCNLLVCFANTFAALRQVVLRILHCIEGSI